MYSGAMHGMNLVHRYPVQFGGHFSIYCGHCGIERELGTGFPHGCGIRSDAGRSVDRRRAFSLVEESRIFFETRDSVSREIESSLAPLANVLSEEIEILTGLRLKVEQKSLQKSAGCIGY